MGVHHSGQIHGRIHDKITKITYLLCGISQPHFQFSLVSLTLTGHVTHKYGFLRNSKIKFTDIFEVVKF